MYDNTRLRAEFEFQRRRQNYQDTASSWIITDRNTTDGVSYGGTVDISATPIRTSSSTSTINWDHFTSQPDEDHPMTVIIIRDGEAQSFDGKDYDTEEAAVKAATRLARKHEDYFYVYCPTKCIGPKTPKIAVEDVEI